MSKTRVILVDDHQMMLDGLIALLKNEPQLQIVKVCTSGAEVLEFLKDHTADLLITDISMPLMSGIELTREIRKHNSSLKIIALSMFHDRNSVSEMIHAGVNGYILKNTGREELLQAIAKVMSGKMFFTEEVSAEMMKAIEDEKQPAVQTPDLTERELEIVRLIAKEMSNAEIAAQLFISERTVESHRKNIFRKTDTKSVVGLMRYAMDHQLL